MNNELETFQAQRDEALKRIYASETGSWSFEHAVIDYDKALELIVGIYGGEDKTPAYEDMDTFEVYHNCYKSDNGFRPRGEVTLAEMKKWLNDRRDAA